MPREEGAKQPYDFNTMQTARSELKVIRELPGNTQPLAEKSGLSIGTVRTVLNNLKAAGVVIRNHHKTWKLTDI